MNGRHILVVAFPSSLNLGNTSLLLSTVDLAREAMNPESIAVWCLYPEDTRRDLGLGDKAELMPSPVRVTDGVGAMLGMLAEAGLTLAWAFLYRLFGRFPAFSRSTQSLARADVVVVQGGDNLASTYSTKFLLSCLYGLWLALITKKKTILLSHTIGPFEEGIWKRITLRLLADTDKIIVRDVYSVELLQREGFDGHPPVVLLPDVAFLLPKTSRPLPFPEHSLGERELLVGIVPSSILHQYLPSGRSAQERQEQYIGLMVDATDYLVRSYGARIVLIAHVQQRLYNDMLVAERIKARVCDPSQVAILRDELDPRRVKFVISHLDFIVTARMHPSIHALSAGVPAIGINYNAKTRSLLTMFGLPELCIDTQDLGRKSLIQAIDGLVDQLPKATQKVADKKAQLVNRDDYIAELRDLV